MIKQSEFFEVTTGKTEVAHIANERGFNIRHATENEFHSPDVTISGKTYMGMSHVEFDDSDHREKYWKKRKTERIEGLFCPDCNAQAFKTDQKDVAVCGDYPGWYFFYRKIDQEREQKGRQKMVLINGEYQIVEDTDEDVTKEVA